LISVFSSGAFDLAEEELCKTLVEHSEGDEQSPWRTVNDGVMGGQSNGGSELTKGVLRFAGVTKTDGGGFSSIRLDIPRGTLAGTEYLKVHMKKDSRVYSMTLRTNARSSGQQIAFRAPIEASPEGTWGDGVLRFDILEASVRGRPVPNAVFDPSEAIEVGLIVYDGEDGPFEMLLKRIDACRKGA